MTDDLPMVLLSAALAAAEYGWPVFPLRFDGKRPALHSEEKCRRVGVCGTGHRKWEQRATTDRNRVMRCWQFAPFNVGVATGPARLVVIDLDTPKGPDDAPPAEWARHGVKTGMDVFTALCGQHGKPVPNDTFTVRTGRGGMHLYYTAPEGKTLRSSGGALGWKVDTRAAGGYVVAAGSVVEGRPYVVTREVPAAPLPEWLSDLLTPPPAPAPIGAAALRQRINHVDAYAAAAVRGEIEKVLSARQGGRNRVLYNAAYALGRLVAAGTLPEPLVASTLTDAGLSIGLPPRECDTAIRSGLSRSATGGRVSAA